MRRMERPVFGGGRCGLAGGLPMQNPQNTAAALSQADLNPIFPGPFAPAMPKRAGFSEILAVFGL